MPWEQVTSVAEAVESAKINLPRQFQNKKKIKIVVGQPLKFIIPFCGKPKPKVTWTRDDKELPVGDDGRPRFNVRNIADQTTFGG